MRLPYGRRAMGSATLERMMLFSGKAASVPCGIRLWAAPWVEAMLVASGGAGLLLLGLGAAALAVGGGRLLLVAAVLPARHPGDEHLHAQSAHK